MFFRDLIVRFAEEGISYCVVGGVAVNLHGIPRMTYDIDIVVNLDSENLVNVERVLEEFGLRCQLPLSLPSFADSEFRAKMAKERNLLAVNFVDPANPLREVDVLVGLPIEPFEMIERADRLDLDGVPLQVVSRDDLIALKQSSGRAQDQSDLKLLKRSARHDEAS